MKTRVFIDRRFVPTEEIELRNPDYLSYYGEQAAGAKTWQDLLEMSPVVVLGEGLIGKTFEFMSMVEKLRATNNFAFFVPLERLHDEEFHEALESEDIELFNEWKDSKTEVGYFFLDALDELKLRNGTIRKALKKMRGVIEPHLGRANIILSCRPADWKSAVDIQYMQPFCISKTEKVHERTNDPDATFLAVVSRKERASDVVGYERTNRSGVDRSKINIVSILPLSKSEIREFSTHYSPEKAGEFCKHIESNDLWHLHRMPVEIMDTLDNFEADRPLRSLQDQVRCGIQAKLREIDGGKRRSLSLDKALEGAERIALAMFLLKRRSIKTEKNSNEDTLDINDVLTDWQLDEQDELISKSLFEPSGIGAVRLQRASQEYLAAKRLRHLRENGMPIREIFGLLFSEVGEERVIKTSMVPVAAWLSLWLEEVRLRVIEIEPVILFRNGLPSSLPVEFKADILRSYVKRYSNKGWCSTGIDPENLLRVSEPALAPVVRELWEEAYKGYDSREILLDFIYAGRISECADLALEAARDSKIGPVHQTYGAWGVLNGGTDNHKKTLADAALQGSLSERVIRNILPHLVPHQIGLEEAFAYIDGMLEETNTVHGLNYTVYKIAKNEHLTSKDHVFLRNYLADMIWRNRRVDCDRHNARSDKDHYRDGLIALCSASVSVVDDDPAVWAYAVAIAMHFGERQVSSIAEKESEKIWAAIDNASCLRERLFWARLEMSDLLYGYEDNGRRLRSSMFECGRFCQLGRDDLKWLLQTLTFQANENRRGVAFEALKYFFDLRNDAELARAVSVEIVDKPEWCATLNQILQPKQRPTQDLQLEIDTRDAQRKASEVERQTKWVDWRSKILSAPDFLMKGKHRFETLSNIHKFIQQYESNDLHWGNWNSSIISETFGNSFLKAYRAEISSFWRQEKVLLPSERDVERINTVPLGWLLALAGVKAEAEIYGWASQLSHKDAIQAARIACLELNGFASFVVELDRECPAELASVVVNESLAQIQLLKEMGRIAMFHDIFHHGTDNMKVSFASELASKLARVCSDSEYGRHIELYYAVHIVSMHGSENDKRILLEDLQSRSEGFIHLSISSRLLFLTTIAPEIGCLAIIKETSNVVGNAQRSHAITVFSEVFGGRDYERIPNLNSIAVEQRVPLLRDLVLCAYRAVPREEDVIHEGAYTPGDRDKAQDARSYLFNTLIEIQHQSVLVVLHEFAEKTEFSHMHDRLRQKSYELAALICDRTPFPLNSFQALDRHNSFHPFDNRSLFTAMMGRLDEFEHDILHAEDRPIELLRTCQQETALRAFISNWLRGRDRGVFEYNQEAVVADENRTDLRFYPKSMGVYATLELKRESWSIADLEIALRDQLVGQYLRHERCQVGCLLICQGREKKWQNPNGGKMLNLQGVVRHLQLLAVDLMSKNSNMYVSVKGIDYS